jgi:putative FmdB family regulatory protein
MPIYEYECTVCGERFERLQSRNSASPRCPSGHRTVRRRFFPPRIVFRGAGFYCTDNRGAQSAGRKSA